jgi:hypothetical protein
VVPELPFVEAVIEAFGTGLAGHGFRRAPALETSAGGLVFSAWCRDRGWKQDAIEISRPLRAADHVLVHLRVYLPCPAGARTTLDGTTVAAVIGGRGRHWMPSFFGRPLVSRAPRFGARVLADTRRALAWFDGYPTAEICLAQLEAGNTSWGLARGASYQAMAAYLAGLAAAG